MVPFAVSLPQLILASAANGLAIGLIEPMLNVGCVRMWPPEQSGPLMQAFATVFGLGIFSSPALVALDLSVHGSFHTSYLAVGILITLTAIAPILIPSPPAPPSVPVSAGAVQPSAQCISGSSGVSEMQSISAAEIGHVSECMEEERLVSTTAEHESDNSQQSQQHQQHRQRNQHESMVKRLVAVTILCCIQMLSMLFVGLILKST